MLVTHRKTGTISPVEESPMRAVDGMDLLDEWALGAAGPVLERARVSLTARLASIGATFGVSGEDPSLRPWGCDPIPRVVSAADWVAVDAGLRQRVMALHAFIDDIYGDGKIVHDGVVPSWVIATSHGYMPMLNGARPKGNVWVHIAGIDLLRASDGRFLVVEDNLRVPSGAAYVMANRLATSAVLTDLMGRVDVAPVTDYARRVALALRACAGIPRANIAVLTPGRLNAAYFEHAFLAGALGAELVEGHELTCDGDGVRVRNGEVVDVIYRRVDDPFLDPVSLRPDSLVGVAGLMAAWRSGQVVLANAPGVGVADDKGVFPYVPEMIRYYLDEDQILEQPLTLRPWVGTEMSQIDAEIEDLILKPCWGAGGKGLIFGDELSHEERSTVLAAVRRDPRAWIAQERIDFTRGPVVTAGGRTELRRMDLRPFVVTSPGGPWVLPGGLTRVASGDGMIVNSSQGGASKDTWICR